MSKRQPKKCPECGHDLYGDPCKNPKCPVYLARVFRPEFEEMGMTEDDALESARWLRR